MFYFLKQKSLHAPFSEMNRADVIETSTFTIYQDH